MEGGSTSVGPLGFWLIDVRSLHAVGLRISAAARTLRMSYRMEALILPRRLRPHGQCEAEAARCWQLAVLDTLAVAGIGRGLRIDRGLLCPEQPIGAHERHGRRREAEELRDRRRQIVGQAPLAPLQA